MHATRSLLLVGLLSAACGRDAIAPSTPRLSVTPRSATLAVGAEQQLRAAHAEGAVVWHSSDTTIATVDFGKVRARAPGAVTIRAISGTQSGVARITVE